MKRLLLAALCAVSLLAVARAEEGKMGSEGAMKKEAAGDSGGDAQRTDAMAPHGAMKVEPGAKREEKSGGKMKHAGAMKHEAPKDQEGAMKEGGM